MKPHPFWRFLTLAALLGALAAPVFAQSTAPDTSATPSAAPAPDASAPAPISTPAGNTTAPPATQRPARVPSGMDEYHPPTYQEQLDSVLLTSVNLGRIDYIERLLQLGANISSPSAIGPSQTPLQIAIAQGNATLVDFLLNHGADPTVPNQGNYPLDGVFDSQADLASQIKILRLLVAHGADVNQHSEDDYPLIVDAFETGNLTALNAVLALKPDLTALTPGGQTVTYMAATYGKASFLDVILVAGGNYTPTLGTAAALGDLTLVDKMLADGVDPNAPDSRKVQPIVFAAFANHTNVVEALLAAGADKNPAALTRALHQAVEHHNREVAALLIRAGADINAKGGSAGGRTTPIMLAAADGNLSLVKLLDDAGANRDGALLLAVNRGHVDVVDYLLDKGADPQELSSNKRSALELAAAGGHADVITLLLKRTANGYSPDQFNSALALAVTYGAATPEKPSNTPAANSDLRDTAEAYRQTLALLAAHGAICVSTGPYGSPFTRAIRGGDASLVRLLLEQAHADPNAVDKSNRATPLSTALGLPALISLADRLAIIGTLLDHGALVMAERPGMMTYSEAYPNGKAYGTFTPLDTTLISDEYLGKREVVQLLLAHGASFNAQGGNLSEGLIRAVAVGDEPKVRQLLAAGADVNQPFRNGWTPLLVAVAIGDASLTQLLLDSKAAPKAELIYPGYSILTLAAYSQNPALIHLAYSLLQAHRISPVLFASISLDRLQNLEAAQALLEHSHSPDGDALLALNHIANRTTLPVTTPLILAHLHPITPADNPDVKPAPATSTTSTSAVNDSAPPAQTTAN